MSTVERNEGHLPRTIDAPLRAAGLLGDCSRRELTHIARKCDIVEVDGGTCVQPLQPLHWVYVVMDGLLAASTRDSAFVIGNDGAIGIRSAIGRGTPCAAVDALGDSILLVTSVPEFVGLVGALRGLALGVTRHLSRETELL